MPDHLRGVCVAALAAVAAAAIVAGCGGSKTPTGPTPTPPPTSAPPATVTVQRVVVTGDRDSVDLSQVLRLSAVAHRSDSSTLDVTSEAQWSSAQPMTAGVSAGTVTPFRPGETEIRAAYEGVVGAYRLTVTTEGRNTTDRADEIGGEQVKFMYVLPADAQDEQLDINNTLAISIEAFQNWLQREAGKRVRVDTFGGRPDITFVRLASTNGQLMSAGSRQRDRLERELNDLGFRLPNKIYAVYYGGGHPTSCADAFWPPALRGNVVALYRHGTPPGALPCAANPFASSPMSPGYLEFSMLHEIFHGLGMVPRCAPNHTREGHVSDDPSDLMYAGTAFWTPSRLDVNRDDYFQHGRACADAAVSPYLQ